MTTSTKPTVMIVHSLPGRVRVRLSRPPQDADRMVEAVMEHPGMRSVDYTPVTHSVLVRFDAHAVAQEEIVLRIALSLSLGHGAVPVRMLTEPDHRVLADSAVFSAVALVSAYSARWFKGGHRGPTALDWAAGGSTALAVFDHAVREVRQRGYFDPEVLSLAYLVTAFLRGNFLKASAVTWLTSFGRHLLEVPSTGVEVRPLEIHGDNGAEPRYELVVGPDVDAPEQVRVLGAVRGLVKMALSGGGPNAYRNLWEELRHVSSVHGEVLEGFGKMRDGIPMRFN